MGNICPCPFNSQNINTQYQQKKKLKEPLLPTDETDSPEQRIGSGEFDVFQLSRHNTEVIEIKPDEQVQKEGDQTQRKKINVDDFKFHKVHLQPYPLLNSKLLPTQKDFR